MKKIFLSIFIVALGAQSCTKVKENVYDKYSATEFYSSPQGADIALANVYSQITGNWGTGYAGADNCWYDLNTMSSDEQVVPHRNTGDWQLDFAQLYQRQWLPTSTIVTNTWNWLYKAVYTANLAVDELQKANADASKIAEAKVLRAFFYYLLMDDYGSVPFYTDNNITVDKIPQETRQNIYNFVVSELTANVDKLSETRGGTYYGRFNKWAGYALLAKVYLNAEVYTGTAKWNECLAACAKVAQGGYSLHAGAANAASPLGYQYYELFGDVCPNDETILAIYITENVVGRNIYALRSVSGPNGLAAFGYNGWNGTIVPRPYYDRYDNNDIRKKQFWVGAQAGGVTYTPDVTSLDNPGAGVNEGVRDVKFYPVPPQDGSGESNDFPIYRYADILLMEAECNVRLGNAAAAKPFVDMVRQRAGLSALAVNPTLIDIYNERGFELNWEGHRRQDMIRFGTFIQAHDFAPAVAATRNLFPIPTSALNANPGLKQNPGY